MNAVSAREIKKSFKSGKSSVEALKGVSFEVERGELFGIIGPDGAGKTTLFRILATLMVADSGDAIVDGFNVAGGEKSIRNRIGYMPGRFSLYQDLTVEENIDFFATLFNTTLQENYDLVKDIYSQIEKFSKRKAGALSGGMKQKLALSCALIHRPSVLFLDEPTTGVDAVSRVEFWQLLRQLQTQNITIVVSTPYMDEASLCDQVALMQEGRLLDIDSPKGITEKFSEDLWSFQSKEMYRLMLDLRSFESVKSCYPFGQVHHVVLKDAQADNLKAKLASAGHTEIRIERIAPTIEDCFMKLMTSGQSNLAA